MCQVIYLLQKTPEELWKKSLDWHHAALTLDLSYFSMGDPLTAVNTKILVKTNSHTTYDVTLKGMHEIT